MKSVCITLMSAGLLLGSAVGQSTSTNTSGTASTGASVQTTPGGANAQTNTSAGLTVPATLNKSLDAKKAKQGDEVTAKTTADVLSQGKVVLPRNTKLIGHITEAKARTKEESQSSLGIVFDKAVTKSGEMPIQASIQAIAAPVINVAPSSEEPSAAPSGGATPQSQNSGGGGLMGSATGTARSTAGGVAGAAGSTVNSTVGTAGTVAGAANSSTRLTTNSTGIIGLKDLQLQTAASNENKAALITSSTKNVKLESGSELLLKLSGLQQP